MKSRLIAAVLVLLGSAGMVSAQINADVLGSHNMAPASGSPITGNLGSSCLYCHAPHSGIEGTPGVSGTPLWSQRLSSVQSYQVYSSTTMVNKTTSSPPLGSNSTLCLSCHDGTVALARQLPTARWRCRAPWQARLRISGRICRRRILSASSLRCSLRLICGRR